MPRRAATHEGGYSITRGEPNTTRRWRLLVVTTARSTAALRLDRERVLEVSDASTLNCSLG